MSPTKLQELYEYDPDTGVLTSKKYKKPVGTVSSKGCGLKTRHGRVHRLIYMLVTGEELGNDVIDHINGNPLDNRWSNLRRCTRAQNQMNRKMNANNSSGYKGVCWDGKSQKWQVSIGYMGKIYYLGQYDDADEAYDVYLEEAQKCFGEFCRA
jgi:hypothetical protein